LKDKILEYFLKYVKIDTMSKEEESTTPSTLKQFDLAKVLVNDLKDLGLIDIKLDEHAIVTALLPSNCNSKLHIGFLAHMDTIPGFSGTNVKPNIIYNYDGSDINLKGISLTNSEFPFLKDFIGKTLITTDGTTVLGADDKAGIANIMGMLAYFKENKDVKHVNIHVSFTPDEEIGMGIHSFNLDDFKCDYAYTVDGGNPTHIEYECFNAASAKVECFGFDIHPGSAKGHMINASLVAMEFNSMLNPNERPEYTSGYEGFNHLCSITGEVGYARMDYIIRDHDLAKLNLKIKEFEEITNFINLKYQKEVVKLEIKNQYLNMYEKIKKDDRCLKRAISSMKKLGINAVSDAIRGGTDGAFLTEIGLNTPNLGTGGYNCHGPYEFACLEEMELVSKILIEIAKEDENE